MIGTKAAIEGAAVFNGSLGLGNRTGLIEFGARKMKRCILFEQLRMRSMLVAVFENKNRTVLLDNLSGNPFPAFRTETQSRFEKFVFSLQFL